MGSPPQKKKKNEEKILLSLGELVATTAGTKTALPKLGKVYPL